MDGLSESRSSPSMPMAAPGKRNHRKRMAARHLPACLPPRRAATTAAATSLLLVLLAPQLSPRDAPRWLNLPRIAPASASGILTDAVASVAERMFPSGDLPDDDDYDDGIGLDIVEISAMRARDIKRRLARSHGYDPDELYRMIDKKDLINALSFEEHKARRRGADRRRWRRFRTAAICTCAAVTAVVFWPLVRHALEVGRINFDVYADRRKHEIGRCRDCDSAAGYVGMLLLFVIDALSLWLSVSVLLSWVTTSKYFFPVPSVPIRPAQLLTPKGGDAGALGQYGINVGPMLVSWSLRFLNGRVQAMIGVAMSSALKRRKRREKDEAKRARKEGRERDREARGRADVAGGVRATATTAAPPRDGGAEDDDDRKGSDGEDSYSGMTSSNVTRIAPPSFEDVYADRVGGTASSLQDLD